MSEERALFEHIRLAIERIESYSSEGESAFMIDTKTQDAIIRNFEIIGEAAKGLSDEMRSRHPDIPWKQVMGCATSLSTFTLESTLNASGRRSRRTLRL